LSSVGQLSLTKS